MWKENPFYKNTYEYLYAEKFLYMCKLTAAPIELIKQAEENLNQIIERNQIPNLLTYEHKGPNLP